MYRVKFLVDAATQWGPKKVGEEFECRSAKQVKEWKDRKIVEVVSASPEDPQENPQAHLSLANVLEGLDQVPTDQPLPEAFKIGSEATPQEANTLAAGKETKVATPPKGKQKG